FFFQAEDGIRYRTVTGVQTCALPIFTVAVDSSTGRAVSSPKVSGRGFSDDPKALDAVVPLVEMELARIEAEEITDTHRIAQAVRDRKSVVEGKRVGQRRCERGEKKRR